MDLRTLSHEIAEKISYNRDQYAELTVSTLLTQCENFAKFYSELSSKIINSIYNEEDINQICCRVGIQREDIESAALTAYWKEFPKQFDDVIIDNFKEDTKIIVYPSVNCVDFTTELLIYPETKENKLDSYKDLYLVIGRPNMKYIQYKIKGKAKRIMKKLYPNVPTEMKVLLSEYKGKEKEKFDIALNKAIYYISLLLDNGILKPSYVTSNKDNELLKPHN